MTLEVLNRVNLGTAVENPAVWVDAGARIHVALADGIPKSIIATITDQWGKLLLNRTAVHAPNGANNYWPVFGNTGLITYNTDANGFLNGLSVEVNTSGVVRGPARFDSTPSQHHPNGIALEVPDGRFFAIFQRLVGTNWGIVSRELLPGDLSGTGSLYPVVDSPATDSEPSARLSGEGVGTCYHVDFSQVRTETRNASTWTQTSNTPVPPSGGIQSFCSIAPTSLGFRASYQVFGGGNHSLEVHSLGRDGTPFGTVVVRSPSPRAIDKSAIACSADDSCFVAWREQEDVSDIWNLWVRAIDEQGIPGNVPTLLERNVTADFVAPSLALSGSGWAAAGVTTAGGNAILKIFRLLAIATTGTTLNALTTGAVAPPPGSTATTNAVGSSSSTIILLPPPPPIFEDTSSTPQGEGTDDITAIVIGVAAACITICLGLIFWFARGRMKEKDEQSRTPEAESSRSGAEDTPSSVVVYGQLPDGVGTSSSSSDDGDETPGPIQYASLSDFRED